MGPETDTADRLEALRARLKATGVEADRLRGAAIAVRNGAPANGLTIAAAEEAQETLTSLLDDIDGMFAALPAGDPGFPALLIAQTQALALLESVGNSYEMLDRPDAEAVAAPVRIGHAQRVAAE